MAAAAIVLVEAFASRGCAFKYCAIAFKSASVKRLRLSCTTSCMGPTALPFPGMIPVLRNLAMSPVLQVLSLESESPLISGAYQPSICAPASSCLVSKPCAAPRGV
jgi:hypothetical protein